MRPLTLALSLITMLAAGLGLWVMFTAAPFGTPVLPPVQYLGERPQGHVWTGAAEEPGDVNPLTTASQVAKRLVLAYTHDALLDIDPVSGELRPALASAFELADDGRSCLFTLRDGATFADGAPVGMEDVLFGWELWTAKHLSMGHTGDAFARVETVEALDARRFRVTFRARHYAALRIVGTSWLVVQRKFFADRIKARLDAGEAMPPVASRRFANLLDAIDRECGPGTGPYVLQNEAGGRQDWRQRQDVLLQRNEHCWRREVRPGTWNFGGVRLLFRDQAGATNALLAGEVDWFSSPQLDQLLAAHPRLVSEYRRADYDYDLLGVFAVLWDCRRPPCDDVRVRRALAMLFDVDSILKSFPTGASAAVAHAKPGRPEYPTGLGRMPYDIATARRLLREAGYDPALGRPLRLVLVALDGIEPLRRIRELFLADCERVGIELEVRPRDVAGYVAEKKQREWHGLLVQRYFRPWQDPYDFLHGDGVDNEGGFRDAEVDALLTAAQQELDPGLRAEAWRRAHTIAHAQQPMALLVHPVASILLHQSVQGEVRGPLGLSVEPAFVRPDQQRR
jgi:ABC-type transport system substrate-binding protein